MEKERIPLLLRNYGPLPPLLVESYPMDFVLVAGEKAGIVPSNRLKRVPRLTRFLRGQTRRRTRNVPTMVVLSFYEFYRSRYAILEITLHVYDHTCRRTKVIDTAERKRDGGSIGLIRYPALFHG